MGTTFVIHFVLIFFSFMLKGTPLRSDRVTHRKSSKTCFFSCCQREGQSSLSCGTLICLLSVGN